MQAVITFLMKLGPLLFGIGFIAPVLATFADDLGIVMPMGLTSLQAGLIVGSVTGAIATWRRSWL